MEQLSGLRLREGNHGLLNANPILSLFEGSAADKRKQYRSKIRNYSGEEDNLWEDFKHGLFPGAEGFADEIRTKHLPKNFHREKPQQRELKKAAVLDTIVQSAERAAGCNLSHIRSAKRLTAQSVPI